MKKKTFFEDFKTFIAKGNVLDMAVGVIIGGAFGKIITSLVNDIIMPPIGMLLGQINFTDLKITLSESVIDGETSEIIKDAVTVNYGNFVQLIIDFLLVALCIFIVVRAAAKLREKSEAKKKAEEEKKAAEEAAKKAAEPVQPTTEQLTLEALLEIKKLLEKK